MRLPVLTLLLASTATAQSIVHITLLNLQWSRLPTLTAQGSDASATTYLRDCLATTTTTSTKTSTQTTSSVFRLTDLPTIPCVPLTLIQGPQTWQFNATQPGALTRNAECKWQGDVTAADLTCTGTVQGNIYGAPSLSNITVISTAQATGFMQGSAGASTISIANTTVFKQEDLSSLSFWDLATVVAITGSAAVSGSGGSTAPTGVTSEQSKGFAANMVMPTGAVMLAGGAVGVLGLAMGL